MMDVKKLTTIYWIFVSKMNETIAKIQGLIEDSKAYVVRTEIGNFVCADGKKCKTQAPLVRYALLHDIPATDFPIWAPYKEGYVSPWGNGDITVNWRLIKFPIEQYVYVVCSADVGYVPMGVYFEMEDAKAYAIQLRKERNLHACVWRCETNKRVRTSQNVYDNNPDGLNHQGVFHFL